MSVKSAVFYWLICDTCGADSRDATECVSPSESYAWSDAEGAGWEVNDKGHYCDGCIPEEATDA